MGSWYSFRVLVFNYINLKKKFFELFVNIVIDKISVLG